MTWKSFVGWGNCMQRMFQNFKIAWMEDILDQQKAVESKT